MNPFWREVAHLICCIVFCGGLYIAIAATAGFGAATFMAVMVAAFAGMVFLS